MEILDRVEDTFLQDNLSPTIAEHATQCNSLFHKHMAVPDLVPDPTIMDDQLARFKLWASNMDVYGTPDVSLDYRLRSSATVLEIIHQLLDIICDTLTSLKPIEGPLQTPSRKDNTYQNNAILKSRGDPTTMQATRTATWIPQKTTFRKSPIRSAEP
ncbi:hypothetical protein AFLA_013293 [Aspergillus flavus NRRL3357]|nr:uncharacterized protein G4B84_011471 [Aspergillus flavus NRRL3357]KAF7629580.1 hypothetical protein AFLA_013293 [Aspergillus flavus NRRL3357]QMW35942.1 hypothetical protein G4B84_011471 [Aspergillus flavus NRRL3357]QMW48004.1 hypothetical protein G4B11_011522 [Aspergillus flavus]